jgi:hypothetical protein
MVRREMHIGCTHRQAVRTEHDSSHFEGIWSSEMSVKSVALVVVESPLIMADLNDNRMPAAELMHLQTQH